MRSSAPFSAVEERQGFEPVDRLGSGVEVPDSRAEVAKDGKQKEPKAS